MNSSSSSSSSPRTPASSLSKSPRPSSATPKPNATSPNPTPSSSKPPKPKTSPPRKRARTTTTPPRSKSTNDLTRARSASSATSSDVKVLLVGGESATARAMTPLLLARGWHVISVVDDGAGKDAVQAMASPGGKLSAVVQSLPRTSYTSARAIIAATSPSYVVWAASSTPHTIEAVEYGAFVAFAQAALVSPGVKKYLALSYLHVRRHAAPWWSDEDVDLVARTRALAPEYYDARARADAYLAAMGLVRRRGGDRGFQAMSLRPSMVTDSEGTGRVNMTRVGARGAVPRADVAEVAVRLLARDDSYGYFDLEGGVNDLSEEIEYAVTEFDASEGEFDSADALLAEHGWGEGRVEGGRKRRATPPRRSTG
ncbi:uncharacterized protein LOC62_04G006123 [Vanrija pseudolonga]|uniref:NAD(P)-binding domain-containing protein n=1 Tax=Vanrija pseudolonga TaxID=143232 RepID=A0AAF0YD64_9TREE|nr:hypothetical protein LOC62_04G006123 [Vanrija pseudolonga]